jgi:hypothetical protein
VPKVLKVLRDLLDHKVIQVHKELQDLPVRHLRQLVLKVLLVSPDLKDKQDRRVQPDSQDQKAILVSPVHRVPDLLDRPDLKVHKDL